MPEVSGGRGTACRLTLKQFKTIQQSLGSRWPLWLPVKDKAISRQLMLSYIYTLRSVLQQNSLEQNVTKQEAALFLTQGLGVLQINVITSHPTSIAF